MEILSHDWFWLLWAVVGAGLMFLVQLRIMRNWPSFKGFIPMYACIGVIGGPLFGILGLSITFIKGSYIYVKPKKSKKGWSRYF